ncbi:hypothetical protein IWZ01DRAFT_253448 [Phyllosticta capitalensis]
MEPWSRWAVALALTGKKGWNGGMDLGRVQSRLGGRRTTFVDGGGRRATWTNGSAASVLVVVLFWRARLTVDGRMRVCLQTDRAYVLGRRCRRREMMGNSGELEWHGMAWLQGRQAKWGDGRCCWVGSFFGSSLVVWLGPAVDRQRRQRRGHLQPWMSQDQPPRAITRLDVKFTGAYLVLSQTFQHGTGDEARRRIRPPCRLTSEWRSRSKE